MIHRTHRLRRVAAALALGIGGVAGVIGVTAGTAGATTTNVITNKTAAAATQIASTAATQAVTSLTVTLLAATTYTGDTLHLTVAPVSGSVVWSAVPTVGGVGVTLGTAVLTSSNSAVLNIPITTAAVTTTKTITVTVIKDTAIKAGAGTVTVTASLTGTAAGSKTFATATAHNAVVPAKGGTHGSTISAASKTTVPSTGSGNAAGTLTVHLHGTGTLVPAGSVLHLTAVPGGGKVTWTADSVSATGTLVTSATIHHASLTVTLATSIATTGTATITVSGIKYKTASATGTIKVVPVWTSTVSGTLTTEGLFTPTTVANAVSSTPTAQTAPTITVTKVSEPSIGVGITNQLAGNETLTITGSTSGTRGWTATGVITLQVKDTTSTACTVSTFTAFDGTPTVTFTSAKSSSLSATPKVTASLTHASTCNTTGKTDELKLTFTNTVTIKKTTTTAGAAVFTITGIHYSVGATNARGVAKLTGATATFAASTPTFTTTSANNAYITWAYATGKPVTVANGSYDHSITPVSLVESKAGTVKKGWVCLALSTATSPSFNTSATPSVKVASGNGVVASTVKYLPASGAKTKVLFHVTAVSSTTKPSTYTLSGLAVNAPAGTTKTVTVTATDAGATATTCSATKVTTTNTPVNTAKVLLTGTTSTQIYGSTADATAAKLLENRFVATPGTATCPGGKATTANTRPVILATTAHYQDALSSQYLASYLDTGTLLTPTAKLSTVTLQALKTEGITQVDIVGGPLVVSTTVKLQLETTPAYTCGGGTKLTLTGGGTRFITVTRIYGHTATETAKAIAEAVPSTHVMSKAFVTAYLGVNTTKGNGAFNDTAGSGSLVPLTSAAVPTAILASTTEFQDAMAASTLSYWQTGTKGIPILLTNPMALSSAVQGAIATLGIKQVILMGGQLAVTNSVVTSLTALGVEVVRVAGHSYTDTAVQLAKFEMAKTGTGLNWQNGTASATATIRTGQTVAVARGNGFTDGLVGADVAGKVPEPLLLTENPTTVGQYLTAFLKASGATGKGIDGRGSDTTTGSAGANYDITVLKIFGGPLAVSPAVISQMQTDIS